MGKRTSIEKRKSPGPQTKRRTTLAGRVLVGLGAGVVTGIVFGDMVAWLQVIGEVFIKLLQITVIPFISVSLMTAIGRMDYREIKRLALKGGSVLLLMWAITIGVILLMPMAFPTWPSASFFSASLVEDAAPPDFMELFIPSNPFYAYANSLVPAIVVFSVLIGVGLIGIPNKAVVLEPLSVVRETLLWMTGFVAKLAPIGVFALIASAAGTIDIADLMRIQVYIVLYALVALFLGLWVIPGLVTSLTPLRHDKILRALRTPIITAFATGSSLIVLPMLIENCSRLIADARLFDEDEQIQAEASVKTLIPTAFTFPSLAALMALSFILFAGWYIGMEVSMEAYPGLVAVGVPSLFGGTLLTIPTLLDLVGLPSDLFAIFMTADVINTRFGNLLSVMCYGAIGLLGALALSGRVRIRRRPLTRFAAISAVLLTTGIVGVRAFYTYVVVAPYTKDDAMKRLRLRSAAQSATLLTEAEVMIRTKKAPADLSEIQARGVLRVGYRPDTPPSAFMNSVEPRELVGFDIEMSHSLARRLDLSIEFVPITSLTQASELLESGICDILIGMLPIGVSMSQGFSLTTPVLDSSVCMVVKDNRRHEFRSWDRILRRGDALRVIVLRGPDSMAMGKSLLPDATMIPFSVSTELRARLESNTLDFDAIMLASENGAAWTLLYPEFSVVVPRPVAHLRLAYAVARGNDELLTTVNAWLSEAKGRGLVATLYRYWMLGEIAPSEKPRRWSVIRDVLGWVD